MQQQDQNLIENITLYFFAQINRIAITIIDFTHIINKIQLLRNMRL